MFQLVIPKKRKHSKKDKDEKVKKRGRRKKSIMVAENVEGSNSLKLVLKKKPEVSDPVYNGPPPCAPGLWNRQIPREVLLKIFRHGVEKFGVLPFLITYVCVIYSTFLIIILFVFLFLEVEFNCTVE